MRPMSTVETGWRGGSRATEQWPGLPRSRAWIGGYVAGCHNHNFFCIHDLQSYCLSGGAGSRGPTTAQAQQVQTFICRPLLQTRGRRAKLLRPGASCACPVRCSRAGRVGRADRAKAVTARQSVPMRYLSDACRLAVRSSPDLHVDVTATDLEVEPRERCSPYNGGVDRGWWNDDREELRSVA